VTPIQVARAYAALATRGVMPEPTIVQGEETQKTTINLDNAYFQVVHEGMRLAVKEGTAAGLNVSHVEIAAKTGTAELGATKSFVNSWTAGFFPYKNPRYAFVVLMERGPVTNLTGATYVMRQLVDWMYYETPEYFE
jgi:penicillin-binding protein 2